ncbi:MAG: AMP-binding protein [Acidobacteriaceae bacterium]|nr:AMP-binding protein [Acidobacteriaceae bacterium]
MSDTGTLLDILQPSDRTALIVPELGLRVSYTSLRDQVMTMADGLAGAGIRHGDRVASVFPNGLPAIIAFLASSIAGTSAPLNPAYPYEEFHFFLGDTQAHLLLVPPHHEEQASDAAHDRGIRVMTIDMDQNGFVHLHERREGTHATHPQPEDIALILHTSGSTGRPKRVPLQHANLAASAKNIARTYGLSPDDVALCIMPLFHIHGIVASTLATLASGGTVVVPAKFNPLAFWRLVREYGVTWYSGVPTMHQLLLARSKREKPAAHTLRFVRSASAPLAVEVIHAIEETFGVPFVEAYGMTEASHQMSSNLLPPNKRKAGSVGCSTGIEISIMDTDGRHVPKGERAEVVIKGPSVFSGYENNPEANAASFVDGWFRTGDQGYLDEDNFLHLTGRIKDLIIRGGENIAPREIDEVLLRHEAVSDAVAFGIPHPTLGEEVVAAVVLHQSNGASENDLMNHCGERLAEFKCPKKIYIIESIPTTATGKVRRREVADAILDAQEWYF